jgi:hypothetical protein
MSFDGERDRGDLEAATPLLPSEDKDSAPILPVRDPRRSLVHAVLIACTCASLLAAAIVYTPAVLHPGAAFSRLVSPSRTPTDLRSHFQPIPIPCPRSVQRTLSDAGAWTVTPTDDPHVWDVSPVHQVPEACIASTVLAARLVGASGANYSRALPRPTRDRSRYVVRIAEDTVWPDWDVRLEVVLEFSTFEGSMLDYDGDTASMTGEEVRDISPLMQYVGEEVVGPTPSLVVVDANKATSTSPDSHLLPLLELTTSYKERGTDLPYCTFYSTLTGAWIDADFVPDSCNLQPRQPLSVDSPPVWINFIGDSNSRNLFQRYIPSLGLTYCHNEYAEARYPVGIACTSPTSPLSLATFSMWYLKDSTQATKDPVIDRLTDGIAWDVNSTLASMRMGHKVNSQLLDYWKDRRSTRTYVSMGSHAPGMTVRGARTVYERLASHDALRDPSVRLLPTTPVNVAHIPTAMADKGLGLVENNVLIEAKNALQRTVLASVSSIDFWSPTIGVWRVRMKEGDAVHWSEEVYSVMARILLSEMVEGEGLAKVEDKASLLVGTGL